MASPKAPVGPTLPKRKSRGGAIAFLIIVLIIIIALVAWIVYEANRSVEMSNQGCEVEAFNQWGQPTLWSCPPDAEFDRSGMMQQ